MSRHYSTRNFFRQMPNAYLARYFASRGVLQDFDFAAMKETKIEPLFEAWKAVPEVQRAKMEMDLREIGDMSNEKGVKAIIDEALFHMNEESDHSALVALLMGLPGHHERAMTAYLDYPMLWKGATRLYHADTISYWRKRKNLPKKKASVERANIQALSEAIKTYYQLADGRAKHCEVEPYRRGELEYFFAFPEDYAVNAPERKDDELGLQSRHPPFEIIFVWDAKDGARPLSLWRQEGGGALAGDFRGTHSPVPQAARRPGRHAQGGNADEGQVEPTGFIAVCGHGARISVLVAGC